MSATTASGVSVTIEWDDSVMIIFSFTPSGGSKQYCGFPHVIPAWQSQSGTQTEVSAKVQTISQAAFQISGDPATWVETVKYGSRDGKTITIVYDDTTNVNYTSSTATPYQLQLLYSITG
ncbi:MAG TPA: hypothetical protein VMT95_11640 [Candidatus Binatia bacterium]|nr:hypothetical protein [Candidatus Binatia bacterium]